jgi:hypothetical protein
MRADRFISEQLLQALAPFGIGADIEAIDSRQGASDKRLSRRHLPLGHARYKVTRARRHNDAVDPLCVPAKKWLRR